MKEAGLGLVLFAFIGLGLRSQSYQQDVARLSAELDDRLAQLAADGQPLHLKEAFPETIPDEQNVVAGLRDATQWLKDNLENRYFATYLLEPDTYPIDEHPEWVAQRRSYLATVETLLDQVEAALRRPRNVALETFSKPGILDALEYSIASELLDPLLVYAHCPAPGTRTARTVRAVQIQFRVAAVLSSVGSLGRSYPALMRGWAVELLHGQRDRPGFSASEILPLLDAELERQANHPYDERWIAEERAWLLWLLKKFRKGRAWRNEFETIRPPGPLATLRDGLTMLDDCDLFLAQETTLANADRPRSDYESIDTWLTQSINFSRWLTKSHYYEAAVRLQLARTALRARAHFESERRWPAQLPNDWPRDPRTGKPFRYEVGPDRVRIGAAHRELEDGDDLIECEFAWDWPRTTSRD